jgi:ABC-type multidrug transport system fused ATPase/permease subunit
VKVEAKLRDNRFRIVLSAWNLLSKNEKRKLGLISFAQFGLGVFDIVGVAAVAMLGALSVRGIRSESPGDTVSRFLQIFQIENLPFRTQAVIIAMFAAFVFMLKTFLSVIITRRITFFLSQRSARLSGDLIRGSFTQSYLFIKSFTQQELLFATTAGVNALTIGVIASAVALASDGFLLLILSLSLLFVEPVLTFVSFGIFSITGYILHRLLTVRAGRLGELDTKLNIASTTALVELLSTYRESFVQGTLDSQISKIAGLRTKLARTAAELSFMPSITKYVMEATLIASALILGSVAFILDDAVHAIAMLVLFIAAGFRIAPAVLRIQHGLLQIKGNLASAMPTLKLAEKLEIVEQKNKSVFYKPPSSLFDLYNQPLPVVVTNMEFSYEESHNSFFTNFNLEIKPGSVVALVGSSGAGKTTLADLLLGILQPIKGLVMLGGQAPKVIAEACPGLIGYVPQNSFLINGTLKENVLLGLDKTKYLDEDVLKALSLANLTTYSDNLINKLDTIIGDSGQQLSGGQIQRLGIARALITKPRLLVLDEATSALDAQTEAAISNMLVQLREKTTVIVIAHRLATIRHIPRIIYIDQGRVLADGTFDEVRSAVADFDAQARLMGL